MYGVTSSRCFMCLADSWLISVLRAARWRYLNTKTVLCLLKLAQPPEHCTAETRVPIRTDVLLLNAAFPFTAFPFVAATRSLLPAPSRSSPRTFDLVMICPLSFPCLFLFYVTYSRRHEYLFFEVRLMINVSKMLVMPIISYLTFSNSWFAFFLKRGSQCLLLFCWLWNSYIGEIWKRSAI